LLLSFFLFAKKEEVIIEAPTPSAEITPAKEEPKPADNASNPTGANSAPASVAPVSPASTPVTPAPAKQ
jgi:hypothetical protein